MGHLPRPLAAVVFVVCASLLFFGLRGFRWYVAGTASLLAYWGGTLLAKLMVVEAWYVGLPAAIAGFIVAWLFAKQLTYAVFGATCAGAMALFVTRGLEFYEYFWASFALGAFVGVLFVFFAPRFSTALFCAGVGSAGILGSLGPLIASEKGPFSIGGYAKFPLPFWVAGTVLFLGGMVLQVALDHETERAFVGGAS